MMALEKLGRLNEAYGLFEARWESGLAGVGRAFFFPSIFFKTIIFMFYFTFLNIFLFFKEYGRK